MANSLGPGTRKTVVTKNPAYATLQAQAKQKGLQPEEKAMIAKVAANRGITAKEARQRVTSRLAAGKAVGGKGGGGGTKIGLATRTITRVDPNDSTNPDAGTKTRVRQVGKKAYKKSKPKA